MASHPIFPAAFRGDVAKVTELLNQEPEAISERNAKDLTPMHVAASRGQAAVIDLLIDRGADVHGPSLEDQWTPIVSAAYRGHEDAVRALIKHGAGLTESEGNPIHLAGQRRHKAICQLLAEHGAVDDLLDKPNKQSLALLRSAYSYQPDRVADLLEAHPNLITLCDRHGRTLLHEVGTHGDTRTARVLLKHGIDWKTKDDRGQTALDRATAHRQHAMVKLLEKQS